MSENKDTKLETAERKDDQVASYSRRNFTKTSLLASPVVMSVVSRPVFGVGCLSNILSGNLSDPDRGECVLGLSPGYWKEHPDVWLSRTGLNPGVMEDGITVPNSCNDCTAGNNANSNWTCIGGVTFNSQFTAGPQDPQNRSMHQILCQDSGSDMFHIIAALLNALSDPNYVLSVAQVKQLWTDPTYGGQISNFKAFLNSTWT